MSFSSLSGILAERNLTPETVPAHLAQEILLEAVKRDCPEAVEFLHRLSHESQKLGDAVEREFDLSTPLGKQLVRVLAATPVRELLESSVCHGEILQFFNCHKVRVGGRRLTPAEGALRQIHNQVGPVAFADC